MKKRVAVLISGRGSNLAALMEAAKGPAYPAEIVLVLANCAAPGLAMARRADIKAEVVDHKQFGKDREAFERAMQEQLDRHQIEFVCLAGFMRLLSPWFVRHWQGRMINIHPALLPAFKGLDTHARALADGVKIHGATVHFVVDEMDCGPAIIQGAVAVRDHDTAASLAERVLAIEHQIYPAALAHLAAGRLTIVDGRCRIAGAKDDVGNLIVPDL